MGKILAGPAGPRRAWVVLFLLLFFASVGCRSHATASVASATDGAPGPPYGVRIERAPAGLVRDVVRAALVEARASHRRLVVYAGAPWCEPCQRFHDAAMAGALDADFADLMLLEFNVDDDRSRLASDGYRSTYIPLFALPSPDGTSSGLQIEGGVKGDGALANILPRLRDLLSR